MAARFLTLTLPAVAMIHIVSPSHAGWTGTTSGLPSAPTVARWASGDSAAAAALMSSSEAMTGVLHRNTAEVVQSDGMSWLRYVTHPEVVVDPSLAVERWTLSEHGERRARAMLTRPWVPEVRRVVSSDETKAVRTAQILAEHLGLEVEVLDGLGENDRSATGFLPPDEFEAMADRFFARPEISAEGWERAVDAQRRITSALVPVLAEAAATPTVVVGHGGVGTLWWCALSAMPISRVHDQPGQGHYFTVDAATSTVEHPWCPIDAEPT